MNMNESHMPFYGAVKYEKVRNIIGQIHPKIKLFRHNERFCVCYLLYTLTLKVYSTHQQCNSISDVVSTIEVT
jgi:hypothetical protein